MQENVHFWCGMPWKMAKKEMSLFVALLTLICRYTVLLFRDADISDPLTALEEVPHKLWVDRYAPKTYTDLLSEEVKSCFFLVLPIFKASCK